MSLAAVQGAAEPAPWLEHALVGATVLGKESSSASPWVCSGQCEGPGSTGGHPAQEPLPPGKAAWLQQEHCHGLSGTLLVLRIEPSIPAAGLRARRKLGGDSESRGFVWIFLWLVGWVLVAFLSGL